MAELQFPLQFKRQYSGPLDADLVFDTIVNKNTYLSSPLRYAGQICSCVEENGKIFILNNTLDEWLEINTTIIGQNGIQVINTNYNTWTIEVTGQFGDNNLRTEIANITANFENRITDLENNPIPDIFRSEVQAISSNLQTQIDNITGTSSVASLNDLTDVTITNPISGQVLKFNGIEWINDNNNIETSYLHLAGIIDCNTTDKIYTINHIYVENTTPIVSIIAPMSGSELFIENIYNVQPTLFNVVLSSIPSTSGYQISWARNKLNNNVITTNSFLSLIDTPSSYTGNAGKFIAVTSTETGLEFKTVNISSNQHNDLTGIQGGILGEYFHLTSSQYSDYIGKTEVTNITGNLQTQIDNISEESTVIIPGYGISVTESPTQTWTIAVTGQFGDNTLRTEVENITANFENRITDLENNPIPDIFRTEIENISSNLQTQINNKANSSDLNNYTLLSTTSSLTGNLQTQINDLSGIYATNTFVNNISSNIQTQISLLSLNDLIDVTITNPMSGNILYYDGINWINYNYSNQSASYLNLAGTVECNTTEQSYTINHIPFTDGIPIVSIVAPTSSSNLYIQNIYDIVNDNFKVILSDIPEITGYKINWTIQKPNNNIASSNSFLGLIDTPSSYSGQSGKILSVSQNETSLEFINAISTTHNELFGLQGGISGEYYHLNNIQYLDYIGKTEVASISANLQSQINNSSNNVQVNQIAFGTNSGILSGNNNFLYNSDLTTGGLIIKNTTESSNAATGALIISGGAVIGNNLFINGDINFGSSAIDILQSSIYSPITIGTKNIGVGSHLISIGGSTTNIGGEFNTINIGTSNTIGNTVGGNALIIGVGSSVNGNGTCIGHASRCQNEAIAVGTNAIADDVGSVALGYKAQSPGATLGQYSVMIGHTAKCDSAYSIALGNSSYTDDYHNYSVAIGSNTSTTKANQIRLGNATYHTEISIPASTQSTNTTSGALVVAGGVGVGENLNVGGNINAQNFISKTEVQTISSNLQTQIDNISGNNLLNDLNDVILTTPTSGNILLYNGNNWINKPLVKTITTIYQGTPISNNKLSFTNVPYNLNINKYRITTDGTNYSSTLNLVKSTTIPTSSDIITTITLTNTNNITGTLNIDVNENDFIGFITQNTSANFLNIQMFGTLKE